MECKEAIKPQRKPEIFTLSCGVVLRYVEDIALREGKYTLICCLTVMDQGKYPTARIFPKLELNQSVIPETFKLNGVGISTSTGTTGSESKVWRDKMLLTLERQLNSWEKQQNEVS